MTTSAGAATLRDTAPARRRGWVLAVAVYFLAVFHRSSLGVAGLLAEHRFGITAAQLGVFVLLQIGVYAAMQMPTGVLVDRYGPRRHARRGGRADGRSVSCCSRSRRRTPSRCSRARCSAAATR